MRTKHILTLVQYCWEEAVPCPFDLWSEADDHGFIIRELHRDITMNSGTDSKWRDEVLNVLVEEGVDAAIKLLESKEENN